MENLILKLGVIGLSQGNGHPYSWSAIFNGYNSHYMKDCPWPAIPDYLSKQNFPDDQIENAKVTHIWTQEKSKSEHIAKASKIDYVVDKPEDMIGCVDAILLARDDAENHFEMAKPFLESGIPIFIDKPMTLSVEEANKIWALSKYDWQVFSCSSLRYASEFSKTKMSKLGNIRLIHASTPKSWDKYAVHIIDPVIQLIPDRGKILDIIPSIQGDIYIVTVNWENNVSAIFQTTGNISSSIHLNIYGEKGNKQYMFKDSFSAFKKSLEEFIKGIRLNQVLIPKEETIEIIEIIEKGRKR